MGCDIHLHIEVKINDQWHHYNHPSVSRNYKLFQLMADVRGAYEDITPLSKPKGLPDDMTIITAIDYKEGYVDWHSESWLSSEEITKIYDKEFEWDSPFGYLFGNSYSGFRINANEYPTEIQDFRFIFWFDN